MNVIVKFKSGHEVRFKAAKVRCEKNTLTGRLVEISADKAEGFPLYMELSNVESVSTEE